MKVLFWDIDGTLLTTGRAGIFAWEAALADTTGATLRLQDLKTAGLTDVEIANKILAAGDSGSSPELVRRLLTAYENYLPESLPRRTGRVLAGVERLLSELDRRNGYLSILLTGNTQKGAFAKLDYYGLSHWFCIGSFAGQREDRVAIARHAAELAQRQAGSIPTHDMFVIGDTPHDVRCGKSIGARTIAVATGEYGIDELRDCDPWRALAEIGRAESFLALLDVDDVEAERTSGPLG